MDQVLISIALVALVYIMWRLLTRIRTRTVPEGSFTVPSHITLKPKPLLSNEELLLYNLIRLAVQDHYLVFARVPFWCFLHIEGENRSRLQVLRRLALRHIPFILVHPGSRIVAWVIQLDETEADTAQREKRKEIQEIARAAGIKTTMLKCDRHYTVQQLAEILDIHDLV